MIPAESNEFIWFGFPISIIEGIELGVVEGSGGVEEGLLKTVIGVTIDPFGIIPCLANIFVVVGRLLFNLYIFHSTCSSISKLGFYIV